MLNFTTFLEARAKLRSFSEVQPDEVLVALDYVEEHGLLQKINIDDLARLMAVPYNLSLIISKRLPSIKISKSAGASWQHIDAYNRSLLFELLYFMNVSTAKHIKEYVLAIDEYCALITPKIARAAATTVLKAQPELFEGSLSGRGAVERRQVRHPCFPWSSIDAYAKVLPHVQMARGVAFHGEGLLAVLRESIRLVGQQYGKNLHYISPGMFAAGI